MKDGVHGDGSAGERASTGELVNGEIKGGRADSEAGTRMEVDTERTDRGGGFTAVNE